MRYQTVLNKVKEEYGMTEEQFLESYIHESVVPGLCNICYRFTNVEPDCEIGYCEECESNSVVSLITYLLFK